MGNYSLRIVESGTSEFVTAMISEQTRRPMHVYCNLSLTQEIKDVTVSSRDFTIQWF